MVPFKPFSITQEVKAQAKAPTLMRGREALQPVLNFSIFIHQRWFIKITGGTNRKYITSHSNTHAIVHFGPASQLSSPSWLYHFFAIISLAISALSRSSAYIFLRRRFSSSSSFMRCISEASMPPNLARHLYTLAELIPCSRHKSGTQGPQLRSALRWPQSGCP